MSHRKPATGALLSRLSETALQRGCVGHREKLEPSAQECAMTAPNDHRRHRFPVRLAWFVPTTAFEHDQRHPAAGLAIGPCSERRVEQPGDVSAGCVAVENLKQKRMQGDHRPQRPFTPAMARLLANGYDSFGGQVASDVLLDLANDGDKMQMH